MTTVVLTLALAGTAAAEPRSATLGDATGDASGAPDLTGASVSFDTGGTLEGRITFSAPAAGGTNRLAAVVLGQIDGSRCVRELALGAYADARNGSSSWSHGSASGSGEASVDGSTLVVRAADPGLGGDLDCALIEVVERGMDGNIVTDRIEPVALSLPDGDGDGTPDRADRCPTQAASTSDGCPPPPPPAPSPPPAPTPPDPPDPVPPAPVPTALERYDAAVAKCPKKKSRARSRCLARAKRANRAGATLAAKRKRNPFIGKAFFTVDPDVAGVCGGSCVTGWVFPDDKWAFRGVPEDGPAIPRCTQVTATGDKDGCLRYALSKDRRTATVGTTRLTIAGNRLRLADGKDTDTFTRVAIPPLGARYDAALDSISSFGIPGVNQTFSTSELRLARDGRFVTAGAVSGSTGQGSDFQTDFTAIGADRKGTYAFEAGGTLALTFADGKVTRRSAFVAFGDDDTIGQVPRDGLFLDGSAYLPDD